MMLQWAAFGVSAVFGLLRLPGAIRGENRGMFYALLFTATAMGLSIPAIYLSVDSMLGGVNVANLLIRYLVFAALLILGIKAATAFNAPHAQRLISGPLGLVVLGAVSAAVAVLFLLSDLPESSTALQAYWDQGTVSAYGETARLYQAYVAGCLAPSMFFGAADSRHRAEIRISAGLMSLGMFTICLHTLLTLSLWHPQLAFWDRVLPYTAVIVISAGLALLWKSQRAAKRKPQQGALAQALGVR